MDHNFWGHFALCAYFSKQWFQNDFLRFTLIMMFLKMGHSIVNNFLNSSQYDHLGGGNSNTVFFIFNPYLLGVSWSNLPIAYFSDGLVKNHQRMSWNSPVIFSHLDIFGQGSSRLALAAIEVYQHLSDGRAAWNLIHSPSRVGKGPWPKQDFLGS